MRYRRIVGIAAAIFAIASLLASADAVALPPDPEVRIGFVEIAEVDQAVKQFEQEFQRALDEAAERAAVDLSDSWPTKWPPTETQLAHGGQLSPKDRCHNHRKVKERHWHFKGTSDRGGPCVKVNGDTLKLRRHAICAEARVLLAKVEDEWRGDYKAAARALKNCIIGLPVPKR